MYTIQEFKPNGHKIDWFFKKCKLKVLQAVYNR